MTMVAEEDVSQKVVSLDQLAGASRRRGRQKNSLSDSILGQYYFNAQGEVAAAEGHETEQATRLLFSKKWQLIAGAPRTSVDMERRQQFGNFLRWPPGRTYFPVSQLVEMEWHVKPPRIMNCRRPIDEIEHPEHDESCFEVITFPQLRDVKIFEAACTICRRHFYSEKSQDVVEVNMRKHMSVSHREHLVNSELSMGIANALKGFIGGGAAAPQATGGFSPEQMAQIAQIAAQAAIAAVTAMSTVTPNPEPTGNVVDVPAKGPVAKETKGKNPQFDEVKASE